jgi:putative addiction module killer protein
MGLVYITGISGAGKSEVCKQLNRLGYWAFDADWDGISAWYDANGALVDTPPRDIWRTHEWQTTHRWCYSRERLEQQGHYGDYKNVGNGVYEMRFFFGSGYRVYFAEDGDTIVLLLSGGDKGSQDKDIVQAKAYWKNYLSMKEERAKETEDNS